jgi:two-component system LytT family response regulator
MKPVPFKTKIIDDEPPAIQRLLDLLKDFPEIFEVSASASNGKEAVSIIKKIKPDLIFLDIQMPGLNGFEMLQELDEIPMIIFCTAYDQYSLKAFETNCVDYLLKPVRKERLEQTVEKLHLFRKGANQERIMSLLKEIASQSSPKNMTSITVRKGDKIIFVKLDDAVYFEANEKYVSLFTKQGKEHIIEQTIRELELILPNHFLRVHRSSIINTQFVKELQAYFNSRFTVFLDDSRQSKIISGRSYQTQIKDWLRVR